MSESNMLGVRQNLLFEPSRRKLLVMTITLVIALGLIVVGIAGGSPDRSPAASPIDRPPHTQLGQALGSDAFNQAYQVQLENMIREQMQTFRTELDSRDRAREARDAAQIEQMARLVSERSVRTATAAGDPRAGSGALSPAESPKYVILRDGLHRSGDRWTSAASEPTRPQESTVPGVLRESEASGPAAADRDKDPFVVPQDGWAEGRLINGVVTAQGGEFRYVQIKLEGMYHSANDYEQNIDGCVILGESAADIHAGRINIKPIKLTCTLPNARTKTWQTAGYVVDSRDGIQGVIATLVDNGGSKLAAATGAGLIQGGGAFYAQRSITSTFSPVTASAASVLTGNPENALVGGAVEGAGRSLGQEVQNYYSAFRPTVQTGGGVKVVVFLTTPMPLPHGGAAVSTVRVSQ